MVLYTADLHFGHFNIIRMDHRPFADTEEMDSYLIQQWNNRVYDGDEVYILGDFCFKSAKTPDVYLRQLKGKKHLIVGNHDSKLLKNNRAMSYFESVHELIVIHENNVPIVLCHYPLAEWPHYFRESYHIYGHIHGNLNKAYRVMYEEERALNAGCMINNYAPVSLRELKENNRRFKELHPIENGVVL